MGFQHANCGGGCVRSGKSQFAHLLRAMPARYAFWEKNEEIVRELLGDVAIINEGNGKHLTLRGLRERIEADAHQETFEWGGCGCFVDSEED